MNLADIIIISTITAIVVGVALFMKRQKKNGSSCSGCSGCSKTSSCL